MSHPPLSEELAKQAVEALEKANGNKAEAGRDLGISRGTLWTRLAAADRMGLMKATPLLATKPPEHGRIVIDDFTDGKVLVGSDAHYLPGHVTTGHKAFVAFAKKYKPAIVVMNGDVIDAATISRYPPLPGHKPPSVAEEIAEAQLRLAEIAKAAGREARLIWPIGNHDQRYEAKIATAVPELDGVEGSRLRDHFPDWQPCWSVFIGGPEGCVIKHRFKGGIHAPWNNTINAGRTVVTGHLHSLKVVPFSDYNGTRYGVDTGCLAEPYGDQFSYNEDSPRNHRQGFVMLTFKAGRLLWPEVISVCGEGQIEFRGDVINV